MATVGYVTNPKISSAQLDTKLFYLSRLGFTSRVFHFGKQGEQTIGPNGIVFSGDASVPFFDVLSILYGTPTPEKIMGLTYDISCANRTSYVNQLTLPEKGSYASLRVPIDNVKSTTDFSSSLDDSRISFRYSTPDVGVYDIVTKSDCLDDVVDHLLTSLSENKFNLKESQLTVVPEFNRK